MQFLTAVFRFLTNIIAVFRFCRLLRFAEMDVFLTRFSVLSYICAVSRFSKNTRSADIHFLMASLRFAGISPLIKACALLQ